MADLVRLKQFVGAARRGIDFCVHYWRDVSLSKSVVVHLADSGHANGTTEHDEKMRCRSSGGYFILIANPGILDVQEVNGFSGAPWRRKLRTWQKPLRLEIGSLFFWKKPSRGSST